MTAVVLQLFPQLTNVNGDAENALVLARRLTWAGQAAAVVPLSVGDAAPAEAPLAVVLGSGVDSALAPTLSALQALGSALTDWVAAGVPLLAVGTGLELLSRSIELAETTLDGLGMVPGDTRPLPARVAGELATDSTWGRLVGYENHSRGLTLDVGVTPFGRVAHGVGEGNGTDGVLLGAVFGTRLHGPVLARNPLLATAMLQAAGVGVDAAEAERADLLATRINAAALQRLQSRA